MRIYFKKKRRKRIAHYQNVTSLFVNFCFFEESQNVAPFRTRNKGSSLHGFLARHWSTSPQHKTNTHPTPTAKAVIFFYFFLGLGTSLSLYLSPPHIPKTHFTFIKGSLSKDEQYWVWFKKENIRVWAVDSPCGVNRVQMRSTMQHRTGRAFKKQIREGSPRRLKVLFFWCPFFHLKGAKT